MENIDFKGDFSAPNSKGFNDFNHYQKSKQTLGEVENSDANTRPFNEEKALDNFEFFQTEYSESSKDNSDFSTNDEFPDLKSNEVNIITSGKDGDYVYYIDRERYFNDNYYDKYGRYCGSFENGRFYSHYYYHEHYKHNQKYFNNFSSSKNESFCNCTCNNAENNHSNPGKQVTKFTNSKNILDYSSRVNVTRLPYSGLLNKNKQRIQYGEQIGAENFNDLSQIKSSKQQSLNFIPLDSSFLNKSKRTPTNSISSFNKRNSLISKCQNEQNYQNIGISSGIVLLVNAKQNKVSEFGLNINTFLNSKQTLNIFQI